MVVRQEAIQIKTLISCLKELSITLKSNEIYSWSLIAVITKKQL